MTLVALEEHFAWDPASDGDVVGNWLRANDTEKLRRLYDRDQLRLEQVWSGALINGRTGERYLDDPAYYPLFESAEAPFTSRHEASPSRRAHTHCA
jgi:hypothetical protein